MLQLDNIVDRKQTVPVHSPPCTAQTSRLVDQVSSTANSGLFSVVDWRANLQENHGSGSTSGEKQQTSDDDEYRPFTPPPPRERLSYTRYQLALLNGIYQEVRYPNSTQKQLIAKRVGITREQVKIWFQNRRRKDVVTKCSSNAGGSKTETSDNSKNGDLNSPNTSQTEPQAINETSSDNRTGDDIQNMQKEAVGEIMIDSNDNTAFKGNHPQHDSTSSSSVSQIVSPVVLKSMIVELNKFDNEYLKLKKSKKKKKKKAKSNKPVPITHAPLSSLPSFSSLSSCQAPRLFQNYDMLAPPNKLTPTANSTLHTSETSAFRSPRHQRNEVVNWQHLGLCPSGLASSSDLIQSFTSHDDVRSHPESTTTLGAMHRPKLESPISHPPIGVTSHSNHPSQFYDNFQSLKPDTCFTSAIRNIDHASRQINAPCLSKAASTSSHLPSFFQHHDMVLPSSNTPDGSKTFESPATAQHSVPIHHQHIPQFPSFNRVYPFPLVAEPPMMLSTIGQRETYAQRPAWHTVSQPAHLSSAIGPPSSLYHEDSYRPLFISSLSNPYFSSSQLTYSTPLNPSSGTLQWSTQTLSSDSNNNYSQL